MWIFKVPVIVIAAPAPKRPLLSLTWKLPPVRSLQLRLPWLRIRGTPALPELARTISLARALPLALCGSLPVYLVERLSNLRAYVLSHSRFTARVHEAR